MTALVTNQLLNTESRKVQFWVHYFLAIMWLMFYLNMKTMRLKITLMIQPPIPEPLKSPLSTPNFRLPRQKFLNGSIIIVWELIREKVTYYLSLSSTCNKVSRKINALGCVINNCVSLWKYSPNFSLITVLWYGCCTRKLYH